MKKSNKILFFSLIFTMVALTGCSHNDTIKNDGGLDSLKSKSVENDQGYQSCIEYINNSSFDSWKNIDINIVRSEKVTEVVKEYVFTEEGKEYLLDTSDYIYTIGDISGHNFANIVCDSETNEVIGYIPTK